MNVKSLAGRVKRGDRVALARAITMVEYDPSSAWALLRTAAPSGRAFVVGVTGAPGVGKSTLVDRLVGAYRKEGLRVGVLAMDPTSPLTGGALLGDRIRMEGHAQDDGVYIRSMASRGWSGGLSRAASATVQLMDAAGFELVILETVGIGQADVEVVSVAHAVVVVLSPGMGDEVQMSKAGLLEVGDVFAVNKADLEGANTVAIALLGAVRGRPNPPYVVSVSALSGEGVEKLKASLDSIRGRFLSGSHELKEKSVRGLILEMARGEALARVDRAAAASAERLARRVVAGELTVAEAAARLSV